MYDLVCIQLQMFNQFLDKRIGSRSFYKREMAMQNYIANYST